MLLRRPLPRLPRIIPPTIRLFARSSHSHPESHYETLSLPETSTREAIKKRFYELSKSHHPDRNRNDPHASKKFIKISSAYSILGNPKLREKYDRELGRHRPAPHASNPVGGRPASGLSRRRTQPQGPPPSYVKNGGWSAFRARRAEPAYNTSASGGGMGIGEEHHHPGAAGRGHVPHFDFGGKRRQHEIHELRHSTRRAGLAREMPDMSTLIPMLMVSGVLVFTVWWAAFNDTSDQNKEDHKRARR